MEPTILIEGINRVVGMGDVIRGGIALNNPGAKYIGIMDRFGGVPTGTTLLSQDNNSVLVNFETMHADGYARSSRSGRLRDRSRSNREASILS